ncbi:HPr kinase/phosphorylase [Roseobacter sinensis]|uniref:HPr kinase/phosphatase C-terminal domain-containing protein n=1 Tax=Roseobacter sinensis TaxID=2931391 RepID=A0ABT3BEE7_9RHOB|nr:HPr kinase/phosphatase C-terminal domain-containing protein [Roseobacter sp. WL0113]MCV3271583.1 HPr kinase/phosphatase C-terminal domain-containing protein [Roseobacter sp. WL0113]
MILHASTVAHNGRAALIIGAAGQGKSSLALQLMAFGAELVADDRTQVTREGSALWASAPDAIAGLIEARGVGLLNADFAPRAELCLVIDMDHLENDRLPPVREHKIAGIALPCLHKVDSPGFPAAVLQYLKAGRRDPS